MSSEGSGECAAFLNAVTWIRAASISTQRRPPPGNCPHGSTPPFAASLPPEILSTSAGGPGSAGTSAGGHRCWPRCFRRRTRQADSARGSPLLDFASLHRGVGNSVSTTPMDKRLRRPLPPEPHGVARAQVPTGDSRHGHDQISPGPVPIRRPRGSPRHSKITPGNWRATNVAHPSRSLPGEKVSKPRCSTS